MPIAALNAAYHEIDIALDTFPYNGTTTTCEAMWMAVPVVALEGSTHASRVGVSLLNAVGLSDLVTASPEAYIDTAAALAADRARLADLHATLRQRMSESPLCNGSGLARAIESAYRQFWHAWCMR
jgi:predicted O-linked N-acetylglucosamine transferase (SPINDLY family)